MDIAVAPFTYFTVIKDIMDMAIYINGDSFGMVTKYPMPREATDGPIRVFSLNVQ